MAGNQKNYESNDASVYSTSHQLITKEICFETYQTLSNPKHF